jgi:hypothetical protein
MPARTDVLDELRTGRQEALDRLFPVVYRELRAIAHRHLAPRGNHSLATEMVESGSLTVYHADDPTCTGTTYNAGSTFIEGTTPHYVRNEGAVTSETIGVFIVPAGKPRRIESPILGNRPF